jgi:hypothetical protein
MANANVTDRAELDLLKYKITVCASLAAFFLASFLLAFSYVQNAELLTDGDRVGTRLQRLGLIDHQEGAQHESR